MLVAQRCGIKLALIAKGRLKELLAQKGLRVMFSGAVDKTPSHRPLVNISRDELRKDREEAAEGGLAGT